MDARIAALRKLSRSFFDRLIGTAADSGTSWHLTTSQSGISGTIELIPNELKVRIFHHEVKCENEQIPCWSFVTDGMMAHEQKEIILTLVREPNQKLEDYPRQLVDLLPTIFDLGKKGQAVDVGQSTLFDESGVPGYKDVRGIGYVEPHGFPGVETRGVALLAAILLKGDEGLIAWDFGLTRITAMLGKMYRYFPYPTWSDLKRAPVADLNAMQTSILRKFTRVYARASYYEERNHVFLLVRTSSRARIREILERLPPTTPLALGTQPDPRANACLVWCPGQDQPMAISPAGSNGSRKTGAFLAFLPEQQGVEVRTAEDGMVVFLANSDWEQLREGLLSGTDVVVPRLGTPGAGFSLEWAKPVTYTSPVTGESFTAEGWTTHEPQNNAPRKERVAVSSSRIILLTGEHDLQSYTTADDVGEYVLELERAVDTFFTRLEPRINRDLAIQLEVTPNGHMVRFAGAPELDTKVGEELHERLESVPAPGVCGPVKLELILKIWDTTGKQ